MAEDPATIESEIRSTRQRLGSNLQELETRVRDATDWRVQFERHTGAFIGAAFGAGVLLSLLVGRRRSARDARSRNYSRTYDSSDYSVPDSPPRDYVAAGTGALSQVRSTAGEVWDRIKGGLVTAAGAQIHHLLGELIPGFSDRRRQATEYTDDAAERAAQVHESSADKTRSTAESIGSKH